MNKNKFIPLGKDEFLPGWLGGEQEVELEIKARKAHEAEQKAKAKAKKKSGFSSPCILAVAY